MEWGLEDAAAGPFQFEIEVCPATPAYKQFRTKRMKPAAAALAAQTVGTEASAKRAELWAEKQLMRTDAENRRQNQQLYDVTLKEQVVSIQQIFPDGTRAPLSEEEVRWVFTIPGDDDEKPHVEDGAAGYAPEDVGGEEIWDRLRSHGEALSAALVRFVAFHVDMAGKQRADAKEKLLGPLPSTPGFGHGNAQGEAAKRMPSPGGDSMKESAVPPANPNGSGDAVDFAKARTA